MNIQLFEALLKKAESYPYTSCVYLNYEDIKDYDLIIDTKELMIIKGKDKSSGKDEIIYACHDFQQLIEYLKSYTNTLIKHVPKIWYPKLIAMGYREYAIFRDYWLLDMTKTYAFDPKIRQAEMKDSQVISDITRSNIEASRAFYGDSTAFIASWINGKNQTLVAMHARDEAIYLYQEKDEILGVILTCVYGDDHPTGSTLWLREIAVKKGYHGRGIGRALITSLLSLAPSLHVKRSFLMADDLNQQAIHLYTSLGFKANDHEQEINMITPSC